MIKDDLVNEFREFINKLSSLEERLAESIKESNELITSNKIEKSKLSEERNKHDLSVQRLTDDIHKLKVEKDKVSHIFSDYEQKRKELSKLEKSIEERLFLSQKISEEANSRLREAIKKEKINEMEENRLKLFEHKLNLISNDEKVKQKLKEIE